jgi:CheY-like chemotaxis protein
MCKKIKQLADYRHIPLILMSANHDLLKFYQDSEADAFLNKPIELPGTTFRIINNKKKIFINRQ